MFMRKLKVLDINNIGQHHHKQIGFLKIKRSFPFFLFWEGKYLFISENYYENWSTFMSKQFSWALVLDTIVLASKYYHISLHKKQIFFCIFFPFTLMAICEKQSSYKTNNWLLCAQRKTCNVCLFTRAISFNILSKHKRITSYYLMLIQCLD